MLEASIIENAGEFYPRMCIYGRYKSLVDIAIQHERTKEASKRVNLLLETHITSKINF
jgi:hypothetical protein